MFFHFLKKSILVLFLFLVLPLAARAEEPEPPPAPVFHPGGVTDREIYIGQWGPQSGPAAPWGALSRGTGVYFQMINASGGIHGRKLKLLFFDDRYDPALTAAGVKKLAEKYGVFAFVGGVGTAGGTAALDYLADKDIFWVGPASGSARWTSPPRKNIFAVWPPYGDEAEVLVDYAVKNLQRKKIGLVYQNDGFGQEGRQGVVKALARHGLGLAADIPLEVAAIDVKDRIKELTTAELEVIVIWVNPTLAILLRQEAKAADLNVLWMTGSALADAGVMDKLTGRLWEGTIFACFGELPESNAPLMKTYRLGFERFSLRGERWGPFYYAGFGLAEPLVEGLWRAGRNPGPQNFCQAMESLKDFKGILGRITYGPQRRQGQTELFLAEALKNGQCRTLTDWLQAPR